MDLVQELVRYSFEDGFDVHNLLGLLHQPEERLVALRLFAHDARESLPRRVTARVRLRCERVCSDRFDTDLLLAVGDAREHGAQHVGAEAQQLGLPQRDELVQPRQHREPRKVVRTFGLPHQDQHHRPYTWFPVHVCVYERVYGRPCENVSVR